MLSGLDLKESLAAANIALVANFSFITALASARACVRPASPMSFLKMAALSVSWFASASLSH
jgi:hypothetical protein